MKIEKRVFVKLILIIVFSSILIQWFRSFQKICQTNRFLIYRYHDDIKVNKYNFVAKKMFINDILTRNHRISKLHKRISVKISRICWIIEIDQCKLTILKKKNRFEFQKNFNSLQLCAFCTATNDKNRNKSNYEIWQTLFNAAKMN